jgi:hypothetical protein
MEELATATAIALLVDVFRMPVYAATQIVALKAELGTLFQQEK